MELFKALKYYCFYRSFFLLAFVISLNFLWDLSHSGSSCSPHWHYSTASLFKNLGIHERVCTCVRVENALYRLENHKKGLGHVSYVASANANVKFKRTVVHNKFQKKTVDNLLVSYDAIETAVFATCSTATWSALL